MSNFIVEFNKGQNNQNKGLYMGKGLDNLSKVIYGVQQGMTYAVAAAPKCGKSTFVNYGFIIQPYIYALANNIPIEFIYFSFEMNRIKMEFDFCVYFLYHDYGLEAIKLEEGVTVKGKSFLPLSANYLRGKVQDDAGNTILVKESIKLKLKEIYYKWLIPLFGEYDVRGKLIKKGVIDFIEQKDNPTGLWKYLKQKAANDGTFITVPYQMVNERGVFETKEKILSYVSNNPTKFTIVVTDTIRKLNKERGFSMKDNIDKYLEYCTEIRNMCNFTFVHIIHLNRELSNIDNLKFRKDKVFPTSESVKDTGNVSEECDYLITMFNPNDDKYNLDCHFDVTIKKKTTGEPLYPNLKTLHIVESRHCEYPQHFPINMIGNIKNFETLENAGGTNPKFIVKN